MIAYYRVSTRKQGNSGLGLEAQKELVYKVFGKPLYEFQEVESGFNDARPVLHEAVRLAKKTKMPIIVADTDRVGRENGIFSILRKAKVEYKDATMPNINNSDPAMLIKQTLGMITGLQIKSRVKQAMKVKKDRGDKMGRPDNFTHDAIKKSCTTRKINAINDLNNKRAYLVIRLMGDATITDITATLNENGFKTRQNCDFTNTQVSRIIKLYKHKNI